MTESFGDGKIITMEQTIHPVIKIQIFTDEKCFGPGIAKLLRQVQQLHSLRAAALSMDMAYSKAWTTVKRCEKALGIKLLINKTGGSHGGGAMLTEDALRLLRCYDAYCAALRQESERLFQIHFAELF